MKFITFSIFLLLGAVSGWNSETHLLIARMAYDILEKEDPSILKKSEDLLRVYSDSLTEMHEDKYPFVECVTLPDDNKRRGGGWQSAWHFDDMPFVGDDSDPDDFDFAYTEKNITVVMPQIFKWLKGESAADTLAYETVMKHVDTEEEGKSLALRLIIHYMGDIHQPLHCSDRYTAEHPKGDKGGNDFPLKYHYTANELHAVWDTVIYQYHKAPKRPFTSDSWADFG